MTRAIPGHPTIPRTRMMTQMLGRRIEARINTMGRKGRTRKMSVVRITDRGRRGRRLNRKPLRWNRAYSAEHRALHVQLARFCENKHLRAFIDLEIPADAARNVRKELGSFHPGLVDPNHVRRPARA